MTTGQIRRKLFSGAQLLIQDIAKEQFDDLPFLTLKI
jgi:hypothetical protein